MNSDSYIPISYLNQKDEQDPYPTFIKKKLGSDLMKITPHFLSLNTYP